MLTGLQPHLGTLKSTRPITLTTSIHKTHNITFLAETSSTSGRGVQGDAESSLYMSQQNL